MASSKPEALANASVVAYLVANAERLTRQGAFTKQPAARTVFLHLCFHPARKSLPRWDMLDLPWDCHVDKDSRDPGVIAEATDLLRRTVVRALDWLAAEGFIDLEREGTGLRPRYGAVTIVATNSSSDWRWRYKGPYGHGVFKRALSPANGHDVSNKDMVSLSDASQAVEEPRKPKRTVAGPRPTRGNTHGPAPHATLKTAPPGVRNAPVADIPPDDMPDEYPVPATRPTLVVPEARATGEAGPTPTANDSSSPPSTPSTSSATPSSSRQRPGSELLGHSSIAVTSRYLAHLTNGQAISVLESVDLPELGA